MALAQYEKHLIQFELQILLAVFHEGKST